MAYAPEVKDRAYEIDPECWESYSGKPKEFKQRIEARRTAALHQAAEEVDVPEHGPYQAVECPCGRCEHWHVSPVADIQGVSFTREQAIAVARLLNEEAW